MIGGLTVHFFNHERKLLLSSWARGDRMWGMKWDTVLPGGYGINRWNMNKFAGWESVFEYARIVRVMYGLQECYAGRVEEPELQGNVIVGSAYGAFQHVGQRLFTQSYTGTTYADEVLKDALANCPLITQNWDNIQSPNFDIGAMEWDHATVQQVVEDLLATGDDQTPPRQWQIVFWEAAPKLTEVDVSEQVPNGDGDAYDDGTLYAGLADVKVGDSGGATLTAGLVFDTVTVPQGCVLKSAILHLWGGKLSSPAVRAYGEDVNDAADYSGSPTHPSNRTKTSAYVDLDLADWSSSAWNQFDITVCIQEIVDRTGWVSGNEMGIILADNGSATNNRLEIYSYEAVPAYAAKLEITYYTESITDLTFQSYFFPQKDPTRDNTDYLIFTRDVVGDLNLYEDRSELYNRVRAMYGQYDTVTDAANDTSSQARYDIRENDPKDLHAGASASQATAENVRDLFLEEHAWPKWKCGQIAVRKIYNRWGCPVHPATVKCDDRVIRLVEFPTFDPDSARCFYVVQTEYDVDSGILYLSPEKKPDTLDIFLARLRART